MYKISSFYCFLTRKIKNYIVSTRVFFTFSSEKHRVSLKFSKFLCRIAYLHIQKITCKRCNLIFYLQNIFILFWLLCIQNNPKNAHCLFTICYFYSYIFCLQPRYLLCLSNIQFNSMEMNAYDGVVACHLTVKCKSDFFLLLLKNKVVTNKL